MKKKRPSDLNKLAASIVADATGGPAPKKSAARPHKKTEKSRSRIR